MTNIRSLMKLLWCYPYCRNIFILLRRNPNEGPHSMPQQWPEFDTNDRQNLVFGPSVAVESQDEDFRDRMYWWNYIFPELVVPPNYHQKQNRNAVMDSKINYIHHGFFIMLNVKKFSWYYRHTKQAASVCFDRVTCL